MTRITSAIAAALIASASFATAALADGDYYEGASKASAIIDQVQTGGIGQKADTRTANVQADVNSGDYFDGANRPN
ncbi:hypothetical protein ABCW43_12355 [Neorhizobium sp. IRAMC:178]|uniref:hypothetical protein n=1 Tax=Neorhizobium tunisiense TaxID=3144793 RepID=UPI0031F688EF